MEKDFDKWNNYKKLIEKRDYLLKFRESEIWSCYIGENVGCEECGKNDFLRPVLILRKISRKGFIGIPTSSKNQKIDDWFLNIVLRNDEKEVVTYALLTQIRFFDSRRLSYRMGKIDAVELNAVRSKLTFLIKAREKIDPSVETEGLGLA